MDDRVVACRRLGEPAQEIELPAHQFLGVGAGVFAEPATRADGDEQSARFYNALTLSLRESDPLECEENAQSVRLCDNPGDKQSPLVKLWPNIGAFYCTGGSEGGTYSIRNQKRFDRVRLVNHSTKRVAPIAWVRRTGGMSYIGQLLCETSRLTRISSIETHQSRW